MSDARRPPRRRGPLAESLPLPSKREITRELAAIVGDKHVRSHSSALTEIGIAAPPKRAPAWLLTPGSAAEISEIVQLARRYSIAVIPVGNAIRAPSEAPLGERPRLFLHLRRLKHVLHLDETSLVVHVQAGLAAHSLEKILRQRGLSLGDYPPAALGSTIGGLLAVRTPGKSSRRHGFIEEAVLGVSAVLADGRTVHTRVAPRRATGPDLARVLCGSEGTIGLITSVVLRIHRKPEARYLAAFALPSFESALSSVRVALREEAAPSALSIFDQAEARVRIGAEHLEEGESVLVVATAGSTDLAACDRDLVSSASTALGGRRLDDEVAEDWWSRRTGRGTGSSLPLPTLQVSAVPTKQAAVYRAVADAAAEAEVGMRAHGARFDEDGAVLFFTLTDLDTGEALPEERARKPRETAKAAAKEAGAFLLGASSLDMEPYFRRLRRTLDPLGIMNPGALTPTR